MTPIALKRMMKRTFFQPIFAISVCAAIFFAACGGDASNSNASTNANTPIATDTPRVQGSKNTLIAPAIDNSAKASDVKSEQDLLGYYTGDFGENRITVVLSEIKGDSAKGFSVVAGNNREFRGTAKKSGKSYRFDVKEPGSDKYDGWFEFEVDPAKPDSAKNLQVVGDWIPYAKNLKRKHYKLSKRTFKYIADAGVFPEASTRLLAEKDVQNMYKQELRIMRNAIYARHGYSFKMKDMREHFDHEDWYMPLHTDIRKDLTTIEVKNAELIKRYEKYAQEYYDDYGR
jgi:hypothetical protein